jgi:hypothetical protein
MGLRIYANGHAGTAIISSQQALSTRPKKADAFQIVGENMRA